MRPIRVATSNRTELTRRVLDDELSRETSRMHDLVIRDATVIDGSGRAGFLADVAVDEGRIEAVGVVSEAGREEIGAEGLVVTPGFIDGHTHMDAQLFWDPLGTNLSWHGITTVVMGNCGFTLAPSSRGSERLVLDNLERAEDMSAAVLRAGIDWTWESFPQWLEAVDEAPKAINYAAQIGHSAIRTAAMGERAFGGTATDEDLRVMVSLLNEAFDAGAFGFTTSLSDHHLTPDGHPVASRSTSWRELTTLVGEVGDRAFELAIDTERTESADRSRAVSFYDELRDLAVSSGVTTMYGMRRQHRREQLEAFERVAAEGGTLLGQCWSVASTTLWSFATRMPAQPGRLIPVWRPEGRTVGDLAEETGTEIEALLDDLSRESGGVGLFRLADTPEQEAAALVNMRHPKTVMTFGDAGAHVTAISGADQQTSLLSKWVREQGALTLEEAVRMITSVPAAIWNLPQRGLVKEGWVADLNVFDPAAVGPAPPELVYDLPTGAARIVQKANGFRATIVGGEVTLSSGTPTGARPGRLLRWTERSAPA